MNLINQLKNIGGITMEKRRIKKTMSLNLALFLMILIAIAGAVAFYLELDQKKKLLATAEQVMQDQQNHVLAVYDQIETNLASIREHEGMIAKDFENPENNTELLPEERIQNEINLIQSLIDENNKLIASLNEEIGKKDSKIAGYQRSVKDLQGRIDQYQVELDQLVAEKAALQNELDNTVMDRNNLASRVDQLDKEAAFKDEVLYEQQMNLFDKDLALHTAYYKVGTYKTLRDQAILEKEGGVLGINRVITLTDSPDPDLFQEIDTRTVTKIPVKARNCDVVTGHDPASYEIEYKNDVAEWLVITDPEKFWSKSNYLVIVVRDNEYDELASSR